MMAVETKPAFEGYIANTQDALIVFEACRRGIVPRARNRLSDAERKAIVSGCVFVFSEEESKIKRWTDGRRWSPSRILNNFLIYREIPMAGSKTVEDEASPSEEGGEEAMDMSPQDALSMPPTPAPDASECGEEVQRTDAYRKSIVGGHRGTALYKKGGLVKKTISVAGLHMISYYHPNDVANGRLPTPTSVPELAQLDINHCFLMAKYFRHPPQVTMDEEGLPRFAGLTDEEPMVRKPPSQQRKNVSEATVLANKAVYYGVASSIPAGETSEHESSTSPSVAPLILPRRESSTSSGLVRTRTSASSSSATTHSPGLTPRRTSTSSSMRHEPYRVPALRQSQTVSGTVDLPPAFISGRSPKQEVTPTSPRRGTHHRSISLSETYQSPLSFGAQQHHMQEPGCVQSSLYDQPIYESSSQATRPYTSPAPFPSLSNSGYTNCSSHGYATSESGPQQLSGAVPLPFGFANQYSWPHYEEQQFVPGPIPDSAPWTGWTSQQPVAQHSLGTIEPQQYSYDQTAYPAGVLHQPQPQHPTPSFVYNEQPSLQGSGAEAAAYSTGRLDIHGTPTNLVSPSKSVSAGSLRLGLPQTDYSPLMPSSASYSAQPQQRQPVDYSQVPQYAQSPVDVPTLVPTPVDWDVKPNLSALLHNAQPPSYQYAGYESHKIDLQVVEPQQPYTFELKAPPIMARAQFQAPLNEDSPVQ